jgi:hypothetical protein
MKSIRLATTQMDVTPAPTAERLKRAAKLVQDAAAAGADLVALPEVFNTGYQYIDANYDNAESEDGMTLDWMKTTASQYNVHIAGTFLFCENDNIYNSAFLVAPDGRQWRYDKCYPWMFERAYFAKNPDWQPTIADTALGKIGMLICWDAAHKNLWEMYAGKVDLILVLSSPPKMSVPDLIMPDGKRYPAKKLGPLLRRVYTEEEYFPGKDIEDHAAWLGVPVVHTTGAGTFRSTLPRAGLTSFVYLSGRPDLWRHLPKASEIIVETGFDKQAKVMDANGQVCARVMDEGDGFALAEVPIADTQPKPNKAQPKMRDKAISYFLADHYIPAVLTGMYRKKVAKRR